MKRALVVLSCLAVAVCSQRASQAAPPKIADPRLVIELFADSPDIKTPIGVAVDKQGRVFVVESHTHQRPSGYVGPQTDRIRVFSDTKGTGKADKVETYFEGTASTMCLAFDRHGVLYVATRSEIFTLTDGKPGEKPQRKQIVRLETAGTYPHNGLSGMAFDFHGDLYFGMGENLGADYKLIGSDGKTLSGGGEGGNIFHCHADGSGLERFATGFWNPFQCCFDAYGRLFTVENDPDSRPPCRLLHVVEGGDYGFRFRYGRKGTHPFVAWNGELPGTLPMMAAVGEAPSGLISYESDNLPEEYTGELLATSWGDHRIDRFTVKEHGSTVWAKMSPLATGGDDFRPVAIAVAPDGSLYVTDWVDKSYSVHGKGRVWHIRAKVKPAPRPDSRSPELAILSRDFATREAAARKLAADRDNLEKLQHLDSSDPRVKATILVALMEAVNVKGFVCERPEEISERLIACMPNSIFESLQTVTRAQAAALRRGDWGKRNYEPDDDFQTEIQGRALEFLKLEGAFDQQAGRQALARHPEIVAGLDLAKLTPRQRLNVLLVRRATMEKQSRKLLDGWLNDSDPTVKFAAIQWIGEERLKEFRPQVAKLLESGADSRMVFEACVATLELLDGKFRPDEFHGEDYALGALKSEKATPVVRGLALQMLRPDHPALTADLFRSLLGSKDEQLKLEAVRSLRQWGPHRERVAMLSEIALKKDNPPALRAEAVLALSDFESESEKLLQIAEEAGSDIIVRQEALRGLRGATLRKPLLDRVQSLGTKTPELRDLAQRVVTPSHIDKPNHDVDAWLAKSNRPGDAAAGARVFFSSKAGGCYRCHTMHGRGGNVGPDLTTLDKSSREKVIESIVDPSKEIAPRFVPWSLVLKDGRALTGQLVTEGPGSLETYADPSGKLFTLNPDDIDQRTPLTTSIMPEGLAHNLTEQEFADLLAYLLAN